MGLFERLFRQPATHKVIPEENLATEVTAYFLESLDPFRETLLRQLGVSDADGKWLVETQMKISDPGMPWDGKIPDLVIQSPDKQKVILVEVKIDAPTTFSGNMPQTQLYQDYLEKKPEIREWHLITLTRWSPDATLQTSKSKSIRFGDIARCLDEVADLATADQKTIAVLGRQWAEYLRKRRWAMVELSKKHIDAISAMGELLPLTWDFVQHMTGEAVADAEKWTAVVKGRSSSGAFESGQAIWGPPIQRASGDPGNAQIGCFYGVENREPVLCAVLCLINWPSPPPQHPSWRVVDWWGNKVIVLSNVAPRVIKDKEGGTAWDELQSSVRDALEILGRTSDAER